MYLPKNHELKPVDLFLLGQKKFSQFSPTVNSRMQCARVGQTFLYLIGDKKPGKKNHKGERLGKLTKAKALGTRSRGSRAERNRACFKTRFKRAILSNATLNHISSLPGMRYPRVLPEPVMAMPTMFWPERAMGQPWAWMGVGAEKPCLAISFMT